MADLQNRSAMRRAWGDGLAFEDFVVGDRRRHWPGRRISEALNRRFDALLRRDRPSPGGPVSGELVFSLVAALSAEDLADAAIAEVEIESLAFPRPAGTGDTIYAESRVVDCRASRERSDHGVVILETRGIDQRGVEVCSFRRRILVARRREAGPGTRPGLGGSVPWI